MMRRAKLTDNGAGSAGGGVGWGGVGGNVSYSRATQPVGPVWLVVVLRFRVRAQLLIFTFTFPQGAQTQMRQRMHAYARGKSVHTYAAHADTQCGRYI